MSHSQFRHKVWLILRHAWLSLWDKHMTTGRINQVTLISHAKALSRSRRGLYKQPHWGGLNWGKTLFLFGRSEALDKLDWGAQCTLRVTSSMGLGESTHESTHPHRLIERLEVSQWKYNESEGSMPGSWWRSTSGSEPTLIVIVKRERHTHTLPPRIVDLNRFICRMPGSWLKNQHPDQSQFVRWGTL